MPRRRRPDQNPTDLTRVKGLFHDPADMQPIQMRALAKTYTGEAFEILVSIARGAVINENLPEGKQLQIASIDQRMRAVEMIMDRAWGKPKAILASDPDDPVKLIDGTLKVEFVKTDASA